MKKLLRFEKKVTSTVHIDEDIVLEYLQECKMYDMEPSADGFLDYLDLAYDIEMLDVDYDLIEMQDVDYDLTDDEFNNFIKELND